jgi:GDPmannose 4,6-dehydratase
VAKLYAYWITVNYREAYGLYACNGILFNHESSRRGETFVTRKITRGLANIALGVEDCLYLGNINSQRDWGHAKDYVEIQWQMLQQDKAEDLVIATGQQITVREFVNRAASHIGVELVWEGAGTAEQGRVKSITQSNLIGTEENNIQEGDVLVRIDPHYYRPAEVEALIGDASLAREKLGWQPRISIGEMTQEMLEHDLVEARKTATLVKEGFNVSTPKE